jgi:putative ABC transport system ATP-binding protein
MIRLEGVVKRFGGTTVLDGLNLVLDKGELVSITGASGSGKSTLLNLIGGMDRPDAGKVLIDSADITTYGDEELTRYRRTKVGFVFQFFNLLPHITVFENIQMPLLLSGVEDEGRVHELMSAVQLTSKGASYPYQLSGGEQQRVAIARALVHNPEIVLADEPTGSLDSRTGKTIMDLIVDLARSASKTVIIVTHEPSVAEHAPRVLRIRDGVIV